MVHVMAVAARMYAIYTAEHTIEGARRGVAEITPYIPSVVAKTREATEIVCSETRKTKC